MRDDLERIPFTARESVLEQNITITEDLVRAFVPEDALPKHRCSASWT